MAKEIKSPKPYLKYIKSNHFLVFLGGSIEMGTAIQWQKTVVEAFADHDNVALLNPRRKSWDASWKQDKANPEFRKQVEWELDALTAADRAIIYFDPKTKAPISLLELGLFARFTNKLVVVCPKGFYRKGNVDIVCERFDIKQCATLPAAIKHIKKWIDGIDK